MSHGRTIGEQTVNTISGTASVYQSSDYPWQVFLAITEDDGFGDAGSTASMYLSPREARNLARKLLAEAEFAEAAPRCAHAYLDLGDTCSVCGVIISDSMRG